LRADAPHRGALLEARRGRGAGVNLLSPRRELGEFKKRYKWMALWVLATFGGLLLWVAKLQLVERDHWTAAARANITKTVVLPPTRGVIRDARGRVIADNRPRYEVYVTPQLVSPQDIDLFASLMGFDEEQRKSFEERLAAVPLRRRTHQIQMFA